MTGGSGEAGGIALARTGDGGRIFSGVGAGGCGSLEAWGSSGSGRRTGGRADACYEIFRATRAADDPDVPVMPPRVFLGWLQTGFMGGITIDKVRNRSSELMIPATWISPDARTWVFDGELNQYFLWTRQYTDDTSKRQQPDK